jgi:hypothetical protein
MSSQYGDSENQSYEPDAVWGAEAIRVELGLDTKEQVFYMARHGRLPGVKKCGAKLVGSRKILRNLFEHISAA